MKYTQSFLRTTKQDPKDTEAISHKLLLRGGFIHTLGAGFYSLLPMGFKVYKKVYNIITEELNAIGVEDVSMPVVHPAKLWKDTKRFFEIGPELWKIKNRSDEDFVLAMTHEEIVTDAAKSVINSYKDLPKLVGQIQTKVRDEARVRGGLLRTREFIMQDAYSFDKNETDLEKTYQKFIKAYEKIFKRVGIETIMIESDTGAMGGLGAHEFMMVADSGEDKIAVCPKCKYAVNAEVLGISKDESSRSIKCPKCKKCDMDFKRGIEVGNIFKLGLKYSKPLGLNYTDEKNESKPVVMGSYGIGMQRLMASVIEASHDEHGMIWPASIAPYQVHLISLGEDKTAEKIYQQLLRNKVEVFYDDRDVSAGEKFADADLIGIPYRATVSAKTKGKIELKKRSAAKIDLITATQLLKKFK